MTVTYGEETLRSGIYRILNIVTGQCYVGSTHDFTKRFRGHRDKLKKYIHPNRHLRLSCNKHGHENFIREILEMCPIDKLIEREQWWMDYYGYENIYNANPLAENCLGYKHTPESIQKHREIALADKDRLERIKPYQYKKGAIPYYKGTKGIKKANPNAGFKKGHKPVSPFKKGNIPWCKGKAGTYKTNRTTTTKMLPNSGSFQEGIIPWNKNTKGVMRPNKTSFVVNKEFKVLSPQGTVYTGIGITNFTKEFGLKLQSLNRMIRGEFSNHNGWTLPKDGIDYPIIYWEEGKIKDIPKSSKILFPFELISKDGILYKGFNRRAFETEHNMAGGTLTRLLKGESKIAKGWTKPDPNIKYDKVVYWEPKKETVSE